MKYFHPKISAVIAEVVRTCWVCQCHKGQPLSGFPVYRQAATWPYEMYSVDLLDLPWSRSGYTCPLVGVDRYSEFGHYEIRRRGRWCWSPIFWQRCPGYRRQFYRIMAPSLRGRHLGSCCRDKELHTIARCHITAHTNGQVERLNQTIKNKLRVVCHWDVSGWDTQVFHVVAQYNRVPHSGTGRAPVDFFSNQPVQINLPKDHGTWREAQSKFRPFAVGALVLRRIPYYKLGERSKFAWRHKWGNVQGEAVE